MKNINVEVLDKYVIIHLSGQFTGGTETDDLVTEFDKIAAFPNPVLIVDFENTNFISSIVIGLLVKMHAKFSELDAKLVFCGLNQTLRNVLKMTKVDSIINISDNIEDALIKIDRL
jgi:anti-anti-sigma factor